MTKGLDSKVIRGGMHVLYKDHSYRLLTLLIPGLFFGGGGGWGSADTVPFHNFPISYAFALKFIVVHQGLVNKLMQKKKKIIKENKHDGTEDCFIIAYY